MMRKTGYSKPNRIARMLNEKGEWVDVTPEQVWEWEKKWGRAAICKCKGHNQKGDACDADVVPVMSCVKSNGVWVKSYFREKIPNTHIPGCSFDKSSNTIVKAEVSKARSSFSPTLLFDRLSKGGSIMPSSVERPVPPKTKVQGKDEDDELLGFDTSIEVRYVAPRNLTEAFRNHMEEVYGDKDDLNGDFGDGRTVKQTFFSEMTSEYYHRYPENISGVMIVLIRKCGDSSVQTAVKQEYKFGWLLADPFKVEKECERFYFLLKFDNPELKNQIVSLIMDEKNKGKKFLVIADWEKSKTIKNKYRIVVGAVHSVRQIEVY